VVSSRRPVACAITGHAIAGGFVLMCACEWRIGMGGTGYKMGGSCDGLSPFNAILTPFHADLGLNEIHMPAILPHGTALLPPFYRPSLTPL